MLERQGCRLGETSTTWPYEGKRVKARSTDPALSSAVWIEQMGYPYRIK